MKSIGIYSIFETEKSETGQSVPTANALLYQDILRYSLNLKEYHPERNGRFRIRELAKWLVQNHGKYLEDYQGSHTNVSNRIEARLDTIKRKVNDFVKLELIKNVGTAPQSTGSGVVDIFEFTDPAYWLAWVAESFKPENRERANEEIFKVLVNSILRIKSDSTSSTIFYSNFYKKCKQGGRFGDMVDFFRKPFIVGVPILTIENYIDYVSQIENMHVDVSGHFLGLIDETLEELDHEVRKFAINQIKLDYERLMRANARNPNGYEKLRFISRDFYDAIVIEAHCEKCDRYIPVLVKYLEYTNLAKEAAGRSIILANSKCPNCYTNESMIIPSFA